MKKKIKLIKKICNIKITKSDYISKTKNRTKKIIYAKNEHKVNYNPPCKFGHFKKNINF